MDLTKKVTEHLVKTSIACVLPALDIKQDTHFPVVFEGRLGDITALGGNQKLHQNGR